MLYALVHYPLLDSPQVAEFRAKHDPQARFVPPHITVMFPTPDSLGEGPLVRHLESVLRRWKPFWIRLAGIRLSQDDHIFLVLEEGADKVTRLHDEVYTGPLVAYRREGSPFVPHVTLGVIDRAVDDEVAVLEEARKLGIDHRSVFDRVDLISVDEDRTGIFSSREFRLGG